MCEENRCFEPIGNIKYQSKKIVYLANCFDKSIKSSINEVLQTGNSNIDPIGNDIFFKAQVDADSLLNAYASLIDYYYIYIANKMNVPSDIMNSVQYKKISNDLVTNKKSWREYMNELSEVIEEKFESPNDIWNINHFIWSETFKKELVKWKIMSKDTPAYVESEKDNGKVNITPNPLINEYYKFTEFLHCNRTANGHKYNIFLELNNFLKHNSYPLVEYEIQKLVNNKKNYNYAFAYYTIHRKEYHLLKNGIIRTFAEVDFNVLKKALEFLYENRGVFSELEMDIGLPIINVDRENGYLYNSSLYFQLDGVLISRSEDSISINANSLFKVSGDVIREISKAIGCDLLHK